jgi:hypothetical protein
MTVYFDKKNFINYFKIVRDTEVGIDTLRMVKKHLSVHLNFKLDDLDEYEEILLEELKEGVDFDFNLSHDTDKVKRPLDKTSFPESDGIFLLDDERVNKIKLLHTILIGGVTEEIETLKRLIIKEDYSFHAEKLIGIDITPDDHLDLLNLPFSTIVFVDRYMFSGPEIGGNISLYDYNLDKILRKAFQSKEGPCKLIFVYQVRIDCSKTDKRYEPGPDLEKLADKIKKVRTRFCTAPEIYLVGVPHGRIDDEHDRFIISNYFRIKSGDSFIYFNSIGEKITDSTTVDYVSLANRSYLKVTKKIIEKISGIVQESLTQSSS